jgi:very-short-patch-repair endonuclease
MRDERGLAELEALQFGVSTRQQLDELMFSPKAIRCCVQRGRLEPRTHGVFVNPAHASTFEQRAMVAVFAGGITAFASHATALQLHGLSAPGNDIEVTTTIERQPRIDGVRMHRSGLLYDVDVRMIGPIPVSTTARAIVDLSGRLSEVEMGALVDEALRRRLTTLGQILRVSERLKRAPGRSPKRLANVVARRTPGSESDLEDFVLFAIERYDLPTPVRQHRVVVAGHERRIDLAIPNARLALEAHGFEYHGLRSRFDADALRGNELELAGWRVLEFTTAFDDWMIASQIARALLRAVPERKDPITFARWREFVRDQAL